jgi:hypothetical protein
VSLAAVKWQVRNGAVVADATGLELMPVARAWKLTFSPSRRECTAVD